MTASVRIAPWPLPGLIASAMDRIGRSVRRARERRAARERVAAIHNALRHLDERTLRDIGYFRNRHGFIATQHPGEDHGE